MEERKTKLETNFLGFTIALAIFIVACIVWGLSVIIVDVT